MQDLSDAPRSQSLVILPRNRPKRSKKVLLFNRLWYEKSPSVLSALMMMMIMDWNALLETISCAKEKVVTVPLIVEVAGYHLKLR